MTEDLIQRQLIPNLDLLGPLNNTIIDASWSQTLHTENTDELIYGGIRDGESKSILIWAIGANVDTELYTTSVKFERGTAVVDIIDIQTLVTQGKFDRAAGIYLEHPLFFNKNDNAKIYFHTKPGSIGKTDHVILLGTVTEPRGTYIA